MTMMKINIYILIKDDKLLEKYNEIWQRVKIVSKKIDSEPVYNEKYLKVKIKSYNRKTNTDLHSNKIFGMKILNTFAHQ